MLAALFIYLGDLEIIVGQGKIALLNRDQRLDVARQTRERFHDVRDSKSLSIFLRIVLAGTEYWDLGPLGFRHHPIYRQTFFAENTCVGFSGAIESVVISTQLPREKSSGQRFRVGFSFLACLEMKFLKALQDAAHVSV